MMNLTRSDSSTVLNLPLQKTEDGRGNSNYPGARAPAYLFRLPVFFCLPKINAALFRLNSVMAGLLGLLSALAAPWMRFSTPFKPFSNVVESIEGGFIPLYPGEIA